MKVLGVVLLAFSGYLVLGSDVLQNFALTNNQFTADIYKEYEEKAENNFVVCPLSVEVLLALIHAGAGGKTANEITKTLRLPQKRAEIDEIYRELHPKLQIDGNYTLQSANKIYVQNGIQVKNDFKTTAEEVFGASIDNINFAQSEAAADEINNWVDKKTHHKIKQFVTKDDVGPDTRAVLLNAIYFKGKWEKAFKKVDTKQIPFHLTSKTHVSVDMMEQTEHFRYYESSELKAKFIELPYEGNDVTMTIVLPNHKEGLPELEKRIHEVVVKPDYTWRFVNLRIPKTQITTFIQLTPILQKLGIEEIFTPDADLSPMLNGDESLSVSKVIQKALIETDEEGTVAAAVTGGFVLAISMPLPPPVPIPFHANHPFIFYLTHSQTGVLFIGRYTTPDGQVIATEKTD